MYTYLSRVVVKVLNESGSARVNYKIEFRILFKRAAVGSKLICLLIFSLHLATIRNVIV